MADEPLELGEISFSDWHAHQDKLAEVGFRLASVRYADLYTLQAAAYR
ncbi:hypothetical protein [Nonomuraea jabiensis]